MAKYKVTIKKIRTPKEMAKEFRWIPKIQYNVNVNGSAMATVGKLSDAKRIAKKWDDFIKGK